MCIIHFINTRDQRDKTRADNFMIFPIRVHKITPSLDYNKRLKHLDTQLNEPTNPKFHKSSKNVMQTNKKKCYYKTSGTSVINHPMSPPSMCILYTLQLHTQTNKGNYVHISGKALKVYNFLYKS